jgi:hypothetical protein
MGWKVDREHFDLGIVGPSWRHWWHIVAPSVEHRGVIGGISM